MKISQSTYLATLASLLLSCAAQHETQQAIDLNAPMYSQITLTREQLAPMKDLIGQAQQHAGSGQLELAYAKADLATAQIELLLLMRADELDIGSQTELASAIKNSQAKIEQYEKQVQHLSRPIE